VRPQELNVFENLPPDLYPIRLQGPWQLEDAPPGVPSSEATLRLPLDAAAVAALPPGFLGLTRNFQRPTNLDPEELVLLVLPADCRPIEVELNGRILPSGRRLERRLVWDLTRELRPSNRLVLRFPAAERGGRAGLGEPILLGIMPDADGSWWAGLEEADAG
jgi:hypothetical protein